LLASLLAERQQGIVVQALAEIDRVQVSSALIGRLGIVLDVSLRKFKSLEHEQIRLDGIGSGGRELAKRCERVVVHGDGGKFGSCRAHTSSRQGGIRPSD
jgi:hypothetical protein